jgi:hypothetical protein
MQLAKKQIDPLDHAVELCEIFIRPLSAEERGKLKRMLALSKLIWFSSVSFTAYFRYGLGAREAVASDNIDAIERANIGSGDLLHIVAIVAPGFGGKVFNAIVRGENCKAVSGHRTDRGGGRRLNVHLNRRYRSDAHEHIFT